MTVVTVAKKLQIDAPGAMIGWKDVKGGFSAPDIQGVIVPEPKAKILEEAFYDYYVSRQKRLRITHRLNMTKKWRKLTNQGVKFRTLKQKHLQDPNNQTD